MKIAILDAKSIGEDINLSAFHKLGEVEIYPFTSIEQVPERTEDADVIIVNKIAVNESTIHSAANLKLVCVTATGTDNLDKEYLEKRNIQWRNVAGYSTDSVAQHTFAMLFYLLEKLRYYDDYVKSGAYINDTIFTHFGQVFCELSGKTLGIIGLGNIGRRVAGIAKSFGMQVIYTSPSKSAPQDGYTQVDMNTLLTTSDIVSIHAPLNQFTANLMDREAFHKMKSTAILLNLGRGPIIVEEDLAAALTQGDIMAAGLDVLRAEPMSADNPLKDIKDSRKLLITPHVGWASVESRTRLMNTIFSQIESFQLQHRT